jgi:CBS domain-containing protein
MMQASISDVLSQKGRQVHTISPRATVREAVAIMAQHNVGALVVIEGTQPVGMFSERDVLWRIVHENRSPDTSVGEVMTPDPVLVRPSVRVGEVMRLMTTRRVRHLPVVDQQQLVGVVSIGDVTKWLTRDLELTVGELESYIHGPWPCAQPMTF